MGQRKCAKSGKHSGRKVQALCLEKQCAKQRFLCFFCVFQTHIGHNIAYLHKELQSPLSALNRQIGSFTKTSQQQMDDAFHKIEIACEEMGKSTNQKLTLMKSIICPQIEAIKKSFRKSSADQIIRDLTSNHNISQQKLERYTSILSFYSRKSMLDPTLIQKNTLGICQSLQLLVSDARQKIESIVDNLIDSISKLDVTQSLDPIPQVSLSANNQEQVSEKQAQNQSILMDCEQEILNKSVPQIKPLMKQAKGHINKEVEKQIEHKIDEQQKHQGKGGFSSSKMAMRQPFDIECEDEALSSEWINGRGTFQKPQIRTEWQLRNHAHQNAQLDYVEIYAISTADLHKILLKIDTQKTKDLTIKCDTNFNVIDLKCARIIAKMKNLKSLRVYMARDLPQWLAIEATKQLSNIQELLLPQFDNLSMRLVESLKMNNPHLNRLCFSNDLESTSLFQESLQFLPDMPDTRRPEKLWFSLTSSNLLLRNLQLQNPEDLTYWTQWIRRSSEELREVTIIFTEAQLRTDCTDLLLALTKCNKLKFLHLQLMDFDQQALIRVIKNNPNLKGFYLSEAMSTPKIFKALFQFSTNLKTLYLCLLDNFNGKYKLCLKDLQTFIIRGLYNIKPNNIRHIIDKNKKIKCLSLNYLGQQLIIKYASSIKALRNLQILNISFNELSNSDFKEFYGLKNIRTLISVNNKIGYNIIGKGQFAKKLKKLSLGNENGIVKEKLDPQQFVRLFPQLTHLKLINYEGFGDKIQEFNMLKDLISVFLFDCGEKDKEKMSHFCKAKNIQFHWAHKAQIYEEQDEM